MTSRLSHFILNFLFTWTPFTCIYQNFTKTSSSKWIKDGLLLFKVVSGGLWLSNARGWSVPLCITVSTAISVSRSTNYASLWNSVERHSWVISMLISRQLNQINLIIRFLSVRRVIRIPCSYKYTTPAQGNPFLSDESFKYHSEGQRVTTDHPFYTQSQPLNAFGQSQAWWTNRWLLWYWVAGVGWERFEIVLDIILKMFL